MSLSPGTHLGPYLIVSSIGAGGMGEVFRAVDARLARDVAIKILPPSFSADPDRLRRFEQEARAAGALNHPNVVTIYDVGTDNGSPYVVAELLEGETLRERIGGAPLPVRKALDYALQVAQGLAAAHEKGIVHRDLKPENIFITRDGRAKILDFGLAKLSAPEAGGSAAAPTSTALGTVMGTAGYMAPEQVRAQPVDHRADVFTFGAILLEMLTGRRAFNGDSSVEIMNAILKEDPFDRLPPGSIHPAIERVVRHCLERNPEERFQSARDLAFDLTTLGSVSGSMAASRPVQRTRLLPGRVRRGIVAAVVLASFAAGGFLAGRQPGGVAHPDYRQLTFQRGRIHSARFAAGAGTIVYSAAWSGNPIDTFAMNGDGPEVRSLGLGDALALASAPSGDMAILLRPRHVYQLVSRGTLARVALSGGSPREILEDVQEADWSPDGSRLAVVHYVAGANRLEYPVGTTLYETAGYISDLRVAPDGSRCAFIDHPLPGDTRGTVAVVDSAGRKTTLTDEWSSAEGLAWSADGREVWFTASRTGEASALFAVTLSGTVRTVATAPANLLLRDIARDGRVLLTRDNISGHIFSLAPGETTERDLSWLNWIRVNDLSADGKTLVFVHAGEGSGPNYTAYLRRTDGAAAIRLGEGEPQALSHDGKLVLSFQFAPPQILLLPTGAGPTKRLDIGDLEQAIAYGAAWLGNSTKFVFQGREAGHGWRSYVLDINGGPPRPLTPEHLPGILVSPDGRAMIVENAQGQNFLFPIDGGPLRPVPGVTAEDDFAQWSDDPEWVYVYQPRVLPLRVDRLNITTGQRELWKQLMPADTVGIAGGVRALLTPDGRGYVYSFARHLADLYIARGLS